MAWETRGNNSYYYRKRRIGEKVVSEYIGKGRVAEDIVDLDLAERQFQKEALDQEKRDFDEIEALSLQVTEAENLIKHILSIYLIASGFHKHKGQWRRKRNVR